MSPNPAYPIHQYGVIMAEGQACVLPMPDAAAFLNRVEDLYRSGTKPKIILISFPHNPTTTCVDLDYLREIVRLARHHGSYIVHDFAYADLGFDGYKPPSILQVEGAKEIAVEIFSMSKSYNMAGWRVGFCLGNRKIIGALARIKSYLDYGVFQPIQIAPIIALRECEQDTEKIRATYQHRRICSSKDCGGPAGSVESPRGTMLRVGPGAGGLSRRRVARIRQAAHEGGTGRGLAGRRLRPAGRGLRAFRAGRERSPHPPGHAQYQAVSGAQARAGWEVNVVQAFLPVHSCPYRCCANGNATLDQSKGN